MATTTHDVDQILRDQLAGAVIAYDRHHAQAASLLAAVIRGCECEDGCECDPDQDRADAATHAQLAQAAATMAQAMATLITSRPA